MSDDPYDVYTQNAVRIENIKEGEALEMARIFEVAERNLMNALKGDRVMTVELFDRIMTRYHKDITKAFEEFEKELVANGREFVAKQLRFHVEAIVAIVTGQ